MVDDYGNECDGLRAEVEQLRARLANAQRQADHDAGVIADLGAQVAQAQAQRNLIAAMDKIIKRQDSELAAEQRAEKAQAQLAAVPVEAIQTVCEPGGYPTVRWFDAQSVVNAWLAALRGEAQP